MGVKDVALLINPRGGENVAKLPDILAILEAAGWKTSIALKEYRRQTLELAYRATKGRRDMLVAYGGDGTLNQVVNGVLSTGKARSVIGLIPGGTANMWAAEIGIPHDPVQAALALVNSEERRIDAGALRLDAITFPGEEPKSLASGKKKSAAKRRTVRHHFLLWAGFGIDAAVMGGVSKPLKHRIGSLAVGVSALKELPSQHPFPVEIKATDGGNDGEVIWQGEAIQIVISNSRRYASVTQMAPEAYIDDGQFDICVITAGDPLSTVEQITSLLLRQKPDKTSAEYFRGAHFRISVPATVPFQLDGSAIKLKDYLSGSDYKRLLQLEKQDQVMLTYRCDVLPQAISVAVPSTYQNDIFAHVPTGQNHEQLEPQADEQHLWRFPWPQQKEAATGETEAQKQTAAVETLPTPEPERQKPMETGSADETQEVARTLTQEKALLEVLDNGRKVTVKGKVAHPQKAGAYIIAGTFSKARTGEQVPVAVIIDSQSMVFAREGQRVESAERTFQRLAVNDQFVVVGKRSKRNVIKARRLVM